MFGFGAAAVAGRLAFQRLDDIARNVSDHELGHVVMLSSDSTTGNRP